jgi:hypothetical protein
VVRHSRGRRRQQKSSTLREARRSVRGLEGVRLLMFKEDGTFMI